MNRDFKNGCMLDLPYPETGNVAEDYDFANLLSANFAGAGSETTAVMQYFYQHLILKEDSENIAKVLECISLVEMKHMELLGELIIKLGGNPEMGSADRHGFSYWSGRYPSYKQNAKQILRENIRGEEAAIASYNKLIEQTDDSQIKALLERIILDEREHLRIFNYLLTNL